ncbi:hypothetical protein BY996DRAFT_6426013 [Phakopsora pachyrhizi]|nr:hypothetical protein BY996DRAFT_6426013 [Phakopsora pachyrhizi]
MYNKPQGTLPEANISSVALRTSAVKSSRWYAFLRGGGSQANSLADCFWGHLPVQASGITLRLNCITIQYKICIFEDFGSEVLKVNPFLYGSSYRPSLRAFPEAVLISIQIRNFEDFGSEVLKVWVGFLEMACRISLRGFSLRLRNWTCRVGQVVCKVVICCAVSNTRTVLQRLLLHTAAVAQYEKGVSCNP